MTSKCDKEVEKYLSKCQSPSNSNKSALKRAATAFSILPAEPITPKKYRSIVECNSPRPSKTPRSCKNLQKKTPCKLKTPTKTPKGSDRFIPPRASMNFNSSHYKIMQGWTTNENDFVITNSESKRNYENVMSENISRVLSECNSPRILQYRSKATTPSKAFSPVSKNLLATPSPSKMCRKIPDVSEKILDAPNYINDYYLNLLHWSTSEDLLAVGLDDSVYVWVPSSGSIKLLCTVNSPENYISSIQWIGQGCQLAIGVSSGNVQLWDVNSKTNLRTMTGHASRVGCLSWNSHILSSGGRSGSIHNHDVRMPQHYVSRFTSHSQEVCGLQWSTTGRYLASGANDNKVTIWDWNQVSGNTVNDVTTPIHVFSQHKAAVKALAWCPWQQHILASGGGAADKSIRFWNVNSGTCLNTLETNSQVSSLLWSETYKELVSSHGYPDNQISIWSYPALAKKVDLVGHTDRVLQLTMSQDKTRILSSAGDETLRLWNCFELCKEKKREQSLSKSVRRNFLVETIR